jgi:PTS system sucrose-specific IIC component
MNAKYEDLAHHIVRYAGGVDNIAQLYNCMTRVRMVLKDESLFDKEGMKTNEGVLGILEQGGSYQVIVGSGHADKARITMVQLYPQLGHHEHDGASTSASLGSADEVKAATKTKYANPVGNFFKVFGAIFVPMLPGFIGGGLILGLVNILKTTGSFAQDHANIINMLTVFGNAVFYFMNILVGVNAAKQFGGTMVFGGIMAGIITHPALKDIVLFHHALVPGQGGVFAVLLSVWFMSWVERRLHKYVPAFLDMVLTPMLVILIAGTATLVVLQPIGGYISYAIGQGVTSAIRHGGALVGFVLAGTFLPLVMLGIHQGLIPIHAQLLQEGANTLYPILAMAGCGQVGASIAVYFKTKNKRIKRTVSNALLVGILGVGEPLIYGVTLPLGRPFLAACFGAAFGGAVVAFFKVGCLSMGISGLVLVAALPTTQIIPYLLATVIAYLAGFLFTWFMGFTDPIDSKAV